MTDYRFFRRRIALKEPLTRWFGRRVIDLDPFPDAGQTLDRFTAVGFYHEEKSGFPANDAESMLL